MTQAPRPPAVGAPEPLTPEDELAMLKRKLAKRTDEPGYAANVAAIQARIAELENNQG